MSRLLPILIVLACLPLSGFQGEAQRSIDATGLRLPVPFPAFSMFAGYYGSVTLRVEWGETALVQSQIVSTEPSPLGVFASEWLKSWRVNNSPRREFDLLFKYGRLGRGCDGQARDSETGVSAIVVAKPPTEFEIQQPADMICESPSLVIAGEFSRSRLRGTIVCDCPDKTAIAGAQVTVTSERPSPSAPAPRFVNTDSKGEFQADNVAPGSYRLTIRAANYATREYRVTATGENKDAAPLVLSLAPQPVGDEIPTLVKAAMLPDYPVDALSAGVSGSVTVRLSMNGDVVTDVNTVGDSATLERAARRNASSFRLSQTRVPVVTMTYRYRLLPGDCSPDQRQMITMRLPIDVEVVAKKPIVCTNRKQ